MGWSYDPANLATSRKDQVRLEIADTDPSDRLLTDEEINFNLSRVGNAVLAAAAQSAEQIAMRFARQATQSTDRVAVQYGDRARHYRDMAQRLRTRAGAGGQPYIGGASETDMDRFRQDTDQTQPSFSADLHVDQPGDTADLRRRGVL